MKLRNIFTTTLTAATATAALTGTTPAYAAPMADQAAGRAAEVGCYGEGPTVTDPQQKVWKTKWCNNYRTGYVYNYVAGSDVWQPIGKLNAGKNWFACQSHGPENPPVGDAKNNIWLYTEADEVWAGGGWGGFPATHVSGGNNYEPVPGLDWCPWEQG